MTNFLSRLVARASSGREDRAALGPRLDVGRQDTEVIGDDAAGLEAGGDGETERVARPSSEVSDAAAAPAVQRSASAPAVRRAPAGGMVPPADGTAVPSLPHPRSADLPPQRPWMPADAQESTAIAPESAAMSHVVPEPSPHRVVRSVASTGDALVTPLERPASTPRSGQPPARDSEFQTLVAPPSRKSAESIAPALERPPSLRARHQPPVVPRATIDAATSHEVEAPRPAWSRRGALLPESRDTSSDRTTVHVTIGRVEIRAPERAPAAIPRPAQLPRDGNLADYLRKRAAKGPR